MFAANMEAKGRWQAHPSTSGLKTRKCCYAWTQRTCGSLVPQFLQPDASLQSAWVAPLRRKFIPVCEATQLSSSSSGSSICQTVRQANDAELAHVARLRAEAYYADDRSRFVETYKRKFAAQEMESLRARTAAQAKGKPICECLVAIDRDGQVIGCIDVRVPAASAGVHPAGVPSTDLHGCYILNVVVEEDMRGQGVGKVLMRAAMGSAVRQWGALRLYTHVEANNEVAYKLYLSCGFKQHSVQSRYESASELGRLVLLQADAAELQAQLR